MFKMFPKLTFLTFFLYLFVIITQMISGIYLSHGIEPSAAYTFLYTIGFLWVIGWWVKTDSRKYGIAWVMDMGLLVYMAWPFFMPYYLVKTRGLKGLLYVFAFVSVYVAAFVAGIVVYVLVMP